MAEIDLTKAIWDYDYECQLDENSDLIVYQNEDAVENAFLLWLQTEKGEIINNPNAGGSVYSYVFKQLTDTAKLKILFSFRSEVDNFFFPAIEIRKLDLIANKDKRCWDLEVRYYIKQFKAEKTTRIPLERLRIKAGFDPALESITYTSTNLKNFIIAYLYEMYNKGLKWNGTNWQWGDRFIFTNLQESQDDFEEIKDMINSNRD